LIRQEGFSSTGADEATASFRETVGFVERFRNEIAHSAQEVSAQDTENKREKVILGVEAIEGVEKSDKQAEFLLVVPLSASSKASVTISGEVSVRTIQRLIQHLELLKETLLDE
jgi:hypothetical protein